MNLSPFLIRAKRDSILAQDIDNVDADAGNAGTDKAEDLRSPVTLFCNYPDQHPGKGHGKNKR